MELRLAVILLLFCRKTKRPLRALPSEHPPLPHQVLAGQTPPGLKSSPQGAGLRRLLGGEWGPGGAPEGIRIGALMRAARSRPPSPSGHVKTHEPLQPRPEHAGTPGLSSLRTVWGHSVYGVLSQ